MQTIIILSALSVIALLAFAVVKSAKFVAKRFNVKFKEIEEWFDKKYHLDSED